MRKRIYLSILFVLSFSSLLSCSHAPKNIVGKEKVILVHGYGRSPKAMNFYEEYLTAAGFQVFSIGYSSMTKDIEGIKKEFFKKVNTRIYGIDEKIHFVGHSMGGLMIRSYLDQHSLDNLGNVVIVGSPSKGTPLVEHYKSKWYFPLAGPAINSLSAKGSKFLSSLKKPTYNLGVIAGFVSYKEMQKIIPGKDDGVVPFESTKVEGMKDFLAVAENHWSMRYSVSILKQINFFLQNGAFKKSKKLAKLSND